MLNRYPLWKNLLILFVVVLGLLYSAPNLYPDDEAILINNENLEMSEADVAQVETALEAAQIDFFGVEFDANSIQVRLNGVENQFRAKTAIEESLTDDYIVALNLAPTTPGWMQAIGAGKMNLGLDLQGGVHFLMEVDMDAAIERRMADNLSNVRSILREQRIRLVASIWWTTCILRFASPMPRIVLRRALNCWTIFLTCNFKIAKRTIFISWICA